MRITYETTIDGAACVREIPFVVGVLADLAGMPWDVPVPWEDREFVEVRAETFNKVIAAVGPRLAFQVDNTLQGDGSKINVELKFNHIDDFGPERVVQTVEPLRKLLEARTRLVSLQRKIGGNKQLQGLLQDIIGTPRAWAPLAAKLGVRDDVDPGSHSGVEESDEDEWEEVEVEDDEADSISDLLNQVLAVTRTPPTEEERVMSRDIIGEFVDQVMASTMTVSKDTQAMINARIGQIDRLLSRQVNEILHHSKFQRLHATWLGIHDLVHWAGPGQGIEIQVLNATKKELLTDKERSKRYTDSDLYRKVYRERYDTIGAVPFGLLLGDYAFGRNPQDVYLLQGIARVAAAAHAPFLAAAAPELLGLENFSVVRATLDLAEIYREPDFVLWKSFRASEDAWYVGLCLPRVLMRRAYDGTSNGDFCYWEDADPLHRATWLWGNPAFRFASCLVRAFTSRGWCGAVTGLEGGVYLGCPRPRLHQRGREPGPHRALRGPPDGRRGGHPGEARIHPCAALPRDGCGCVLERRLVPGC